MIGKCSVTRRGFTMTSDYREKLYRVVFGLAAIYNFAFGLWA
jgi:hypothetical protein